MHFLKNPQSGTSIRYRSATLASMAVLSIVVTSACSSAESQVNTKEVPATASSAAPPATADSETKPSPSVAPAVKTKEIKDLEKQGIKLGEVIEIAEGSYPSYKVEASSPIARYDASTQTSPPKGWSEKDLKDGHLYAANFLMNHVLDNPARTNFEKNKDIAKSHVSNELAAKNKQEILDSMSSNETTIFPKDVFEGPDYLGYTLINDGKTPRNKNIDIKALSSEGWENGNYIEFAGDYTLSAKETKTNKPKDIDAKMKFGLTVDKIGEGNFKISGANSIEILYEDIQ